MLSRKVQPQIIMEENESHIFFCVINVNIIPSVKIVQLIENYLKNVHYDLKSNLLSFKMNKEYLPPQKIVAPLAAEPISAIAYEKETEILHVFDFMEYDDLTSLELKLNELSTQFMWMGNNELNMEDVDQIVNAFERSSSILLLYTQTQTLGIAIRDLTEVIKKDEKRFISMAAQMSTLCKGFNNDLILWLRSLFYDGAPSVNFMDASIMSNIQMIRSFLEPEPEVTLDDTDGFEFF